MDNIEEIIKLLNRIQQVSRGLPSMDDWLNVIGDTQQIEKLLTGKIEGTK